MNSNANKAIVTTVLSLPNPSDYEPLDEGTSAAFKSCAELERKVVLSGKPLLSFWVCAKDLPDVGPLAATKVDIQSSTSETRALLMTGPSRYAISLLAVNCVQKFQCTELAWIAVLGMTRCSCECQALVFALVRYSQEHPEELITCLTLQDLFSRGRATHEAVHRWLKDNDIAVNRSVWNA